MKLEQVALEVERSSTFTEKKFGFASNAALYELLSSKVYSDVPLAIVRELSTNASDSHTDAGKADVPFDVHLPNVLEPWFSIRDYGTGLSPEGIDAVYSMYGESTRTKSDDFTGCLGIGSKSPFAYTDQFTIVSNWQGKKYTYSAFKNEEHIPSIAHLSTIDTDECNGLEIRVSIHPGDDRLFSRAARLVYLHFKVCPNISGVTIDLTTVQPIVQTPEFSLYDKHDMQSSSGRINVVMGQVCYAVSENKIGHTSLGHNAVLVLNMPVGYCKFAASREELQYDERTIERVRAAIVAATDVAKIQFEASVATEPYLMLKLSKIRKYHNFVNNLTVNGTASVYSEEQGKYSLRKAAIRRGDKLFMQQSYQDFYGGEYADNMIFIEDDVADITQNLKNRLRAFVRSNGRSSVYLAKIEDRARFTELFGPVLTKMSLLPDVPRVARNTNSRTSARSKPIKLLRDSSGDNMLYDWENINDGNEIDPIDACCVLRDGNWVIWNGQRVRPNKIRKIADALGFKRVYGIAEKRYDTSRVRYSIPELAIEAKTKTQALLAALDKYALAKFMHGIDSERRFDLMKLKGLSTECDDYINTIEADADNVYFYRELAKMLNVDMPSIATNYQEVFCNKYPILVYINQYGDRINMDHIVQYVKLIEASTPQ